jgi:hypothetical protein
MQFLFTIEIEKAKFCYNTGGEVTFTTIVWSVPVPRLFHSNNIYPSCKTVIVGFAR